MAARCEALKSASFAASGRFKRKYDNVPFVVPEGDIYLKGAFDDGRLRFDYGRPEYVLAPEAIAKRLKQPNFGNDEAEKLALQVLSSRPDPKEYVVARVESYFIRTPVKAAYWVNYSPTVFLVALNVPLPSTVTWFDINALGLYGWLEFKKPLSAVELLNSYGKQDSFEVEKLEGEMWRFSLIHDNSLSSSRWEVDINAGEGFTPVQLRVLEIPESGRGAPRVVQSSSVAWENKNGAWVPVKYHIQKGSEESKSFESIDLTFTYDRVNESIDDSVFSYESFPTPKFAGVIDSSGEKPVVVRAHYEGDNDPALFREGPRSSGIGRLLILVNAIVLAVVFGLFVRSWKRKRGSLNLEKTSARD